MGILLGELFDDLPCSVAASVVYEEDGAVAGYEACFVQVFYFFEEERRTDRSLEIEANKWAQYILDLYFYENSANQ